MEESITKKSFLFFLILLGSLNKINIKINKRMLINLYCIKTLFKLKSKFSIL